MFSDRKTQPGLENLHGYLKVYKYHITSLSTKQELPWFCTGFQQKEIDTCSFNKKVL